MPDQEQILTSRIEHLEGELSKARAALHRPHFVEDYERFLDELLATHPLDEAMALAVGGQYDSIGAALADVVEFCGLDASTSLVDFGCGSGRLAKHLGLRFPQLEYVGIDIVPRLLDYAATQTPPNFKFMISHELVLPLPDATADMIVVFSVFTHLLHQESFCLLRDMRRLLRPRGRIVFSFLESGPNWPVFSGMVERAANGQRDDQLNMFTERSQLERWFAELDLRCLGYEWGTPHSGGGQTVVVCERR